MPEYALYHLTLTTLTPLHIGSGVTLLDEYDYAVRDGATWRLDEGVLLDAQAVDDPVQVERLAATPPAQLLSAADFTPGSPFFRYVIDGAPRATGAGALLQEQLKDADDRPYLPGSSLKGALRTGLGWYAWKILGLTPEMSRLNRGAKWAAQGYEREIFGDNPNRDALRALQVSDSTPVSPERLMILNARGLGRAGRLDTPVELEALRSETVFELDLKLDLALYSDWARAHRLNLFGEGGLGQLPAIMNTRALLRARREAAWYAGVPGASRLLGFYQQMAGIQPGDNQFVVQLGWGTGWEDKTFGERLTAHERFFKSAFAEYRLGKGRATAANFPTTRRVAAAYRRDAADSVAEVPAYPLGWALVTFEHIRGPQVWTHSRPLEETAVPPAADRTPGAPEQPPVKTRVPAQRDRSRRRESPAPGGKPAGARRAERPAAEVKAPAPVVAAFNAAPRPGQRFIGKVYSVEPGVVWVELPGTLDPDEWMGMAPAPAEKVKEGDSIACIVRQVRQEKNKTWTVECAIEGAG